MNIEYRILTVEDVNDYQSIRLELLKNNPKSFGSSFEEESTFLIDRWESRLQNKNATSFGAYSGKEIIGLCVLVENPRMKMKHKATLNSMYVKPAYRRKGISKRLLSNVFQYVESRNIEIITLSVVSNNIGARKLYEKLGFVEEGMEKKAIKYDNEYFDLILMQKYF
jgi:ribosomal protein S18 acetylase RimI-like enzyme